MMRAVFRSRAHVRLALLSLLLVGVATWGLHYLQTALEQAEHTKTVRPFSMGFLLPILALTALGGRWFGRLTLALSVWMTALVLVPPAFNLMVHRPRDWAELALLIVIGEAVVRFVDLIRRDMALQEDVDQSPLSRSMLEEAKTFARSVSGVERLGPCLFRRRGVQYMVDMDVYVEGGLSVAQGQQVAGRIEAGVRAEHPLIQSVRVRVRAGE